MVGPRCLLSSCLGGLHEALLHRSCGRIGAVKPTIDIVRGVKELTETPGKYVMSALWARVEGFGQTLRSMSLYGSDLAASSLFAGILPKLISHRVQLRYVATLLDAISIASRGEVGFTYSCSRSLRACDQTLSLFSHPVYLELSKTQVAQGP